MNTRRSRWTFRKAAVLTEFFKQGDLEKSRGDLPPTIMDRDKCVIPELEIQFLQSICVPLFEILGNILPKAAPSVRIIENHIERWDAAIPIFAELSFKEKEKLRLEAEAAAAAEANENN
ncbi:unnamed protein product [Diatraea saccharalis]|uniref:PDEase domain-containing protein n=1 Tax=Diatraea saccharalis TaxID=40085 RepID=A0A9N9QY81_9NEOP|nr:unnamed protein product [Diatraea saccharalis]